MFAPVPETTPLHHLNLPDAVLSAIQRRTHKLRPQIRDLTRLTAAEVMSFDYVGELKLNQVREALTAAGHRLKYDPPVGTGVSVDAAEVDEVLARMHTRLESLRRELDDVVDLVEAGRARLTSVECDTDADVS